eukprot:3639065-Pyramimonas_sp.AAC.1
MVYYRVYIEHHAAALNPNLQVVHVQACPVSNETCKHHILSAVADAAEGADAAVVCIGEGNYAEKPGNIDDLVIT